jgi:diguanylate cyclase
MMATLSSLPTIDESLSNAMRRARSALNLLAELHIPPTPARFAVAYAHQLGALADLSLAMNRLISHDRLTTEAVDELYQQFFANEANPAELNDASRKIQDTVGEVAEQIEGSSHRHQSFADGLAGFAEALSDGDATAEQTESLLTLTREVNLDHQRLQDRLNFTLRELETLRGQLDRAEREARIDTLTGIGNRAQFDRQMRAAVAHARRDHEPLCLMMIDIDNFKRFNDLYGHQMGDQVLKLVAHQLTVVAGEAYQPARYGGEEFALVLSRGDLAEASGLAEKLRKKVEGRKVINRRTGQTLGQVTLSVGVARYRPGETAAELVHRADEAMYRAKAQGRNCVVTDEQLES